MKRHISTLAIAAIALATMAVGVSITAAEAEAATPPLLRQFCPTGSGAGQCNLPRGIVADPATGNIFVSDQGNHRINKFSPWGEFLLAWGGGVRNGAPEAQICGPAATPPSSCQAGGMGTELGDIVWPEGIAIDAAQNLYVYDHINNRMQKFDSEGHPLLVFGGEVNETTGANVCTAASGNDCGPGAVGTAPGFFTQPGNVSPVGDVSSYVAIGSANRVYVGDNERVQVFDQSGAFVRSMPLAGKRVQSLAVDPAGNMYLAFIKEAYFSFPNVQKVDSTGAPLCTMTVPNPQGIALDGSGNTYVINRAGNGSSGVLEFDSSCSRVDLGVPDPGLGADVFERSTGIATSEACDNPGVGILRSNADSFDSFVRLYGSPPNPAVCPPPAVAPSIAAQFATRVDSGGATLRARINPHFWVDTRYHVQYGTGRCSEGGCTAERPLPPGSKLTGDVADAVVETADVFLEGLEPGTTYHYRFVAQSGGGGPVRGVGGTEGLDGAEGTFRTPPLNSDLNAGCPNLAFRVGVGSRLPDCRAYELVSPLDKNNGDIAYGSITRLAQASTDGERMSFNSYRSFGDPEGAPLISQFVAQRHAGEGWSTESVSPPRGAVSLTPIGGPGNFQYRLFSDDLCSGWFAQDSDLALAPGAPAEVPNIYRRQNCGETAYETITSAPPPGFGFAPPNTEYYPLPQGFSADLTRTVFRANAALEVAEGSPNAPLRCRAEATGEKTSISWLRNGADTGTTGGTYAPGGADQGTAIQCQVRSTDSEGTVLATSQVAWVGPMPVIPAPSPGYSLSASRPLPGEPIVSGSAVVGSTLICTPGSWRYGPAFTYRWLRNGGAISGATAPDYTLVAADKGQAIQCEITGSNASGAATLQSKPRLIEARSPVPGIAPSLSGTPTAGETLSCDPGTWSNSPTLTYQWLRGATPIAGATASTYTLEAADEGTAVQCRVSGANGDGTALAVSNRLVVSPPPGTAPPAQDTPASVTGGAAVGEALTCGPGSWSGSPTFAYQWLRNGSAIGATTADYTLVDADRGKAIQCQVTASNAGGSALAIAPPRYVDPSPPSAAAEIHSVTQVYLTLGDGSLRLISVMPNGKPATTHSSVGTPQSGPLGLVNNDLIYGAVSEDGRRVFWSHSESTDLAWNGGAEGVKPGPLYLRLNASEPQSPVSAGKCTEAEQACTIPVSAAPTTRFVAADPEGTRVLYTTGPLGNEQLFEASIEEVGGQTVATSQPIASGVKGVLGASEDTSRVYLFSTQVLSGDQQNGHGDKASAGEPNLYLYEAGVGFTFVATLAIRDLHRAAVADVPSPAAVGPTGRNSRISPDGLVAAFVAVATPTGYDNADAISGEPDRELYVYDRSAGAVGELLCVSCNPSGARPRGRGIPGNSFDGSRWVAAEIPGWISPLHPGNALSANGKRLFFDSYDSLVPADTNGRKDVYEWERAGAGNCTEQSPAFSEQNGGCVFLISSGQSPEDSEFFDATPSGSDVFFATQSSLVGQDYGLVDVYDARIDGGLPEPAPRAPGCEGEACQGTPSPPNDPTPASSAFQGAGNVKQGGKAKPRCAKGKARKKGRCVKKKAKKKPTKKRSAKQRANHNGRNGR